MSDYPAVLYVEDDSESREVMQLLLVQHMGLSSVTIFGDSADFLARVQALQPKPDIILLDIHVQPHTGFEMLEMLRQVRDFDNTPIVALTASVMNEEVQKLKTIGFNGVVAKPIDMDTFPEILDRVLNGKEIWRIAG